MWFGSSVVECRDGIPEALGSNPGRARYFFTTCYKRPLCGKETVLVKRNPGKKLYWLKEIQESMDRCFGCCDITDILSKMALNTIQPKYH